MTYEMAALELYHSLFGNNQTNYHTLLFQLIQKADPQNKELLRRVYPMEVSVFDDWQMSMGSTEFFGKFGFKVPV